MRWYLFALTSLVATSVSAESRPLPRDLSGSYFCKATASAGIRLNTDTGRWQSAQFKTENDNLILKIQATGETGELDFLPLKYRLYNVEVREFGSAEKGRECVDWGAPEKFRPNVRATGEAIRCTMPSFNYWFNLETKKYQMQFDGGYMGEDGNTDTPAITVGVCEQID